MSKMRSMTDSIIESTLDTKNNISFDIMINAPLLLIIIAHNKNDILAIDMGYIEIKTNENIWNVNCNDIEINNDLNNKEEKVDIDNNYNKKFIRKNLGENNKNVNYFNNLYRSNIDFNNNINENNNDNKREKSSYETLHISLSQIEINMLNIENDMTKEKSEKSEIFNKKSRRNTYKKYSRLVDKFSISVEALISKDPWGTKYAPLKLFIDLPDIKLR